MTDTHKKDFQLLRIDGVENLSFFWVSHFDFFCFIPIQISNNLCDSKDWTKGPGAKNDTTESLGCFNQILTFESRKWSPVATF